MKIRALLVGLVAVGLSAAAACCRPDRDQVQPRRRPGHAQGQGGRKVQGARRAIHQRRGQGRGVRQQHAVQGQGRDGGAAARRRAAPRPLAGQVRPARRARVRGLRPALHLRRLRGPEQDHPGRGRPAAARQARAQGHPRPGLLGQRLQVVLGQHPDHEARGPARQEDAHPVVQGARGADARGQVAAAGDGLLRGLSGAADRRRRWHREPALQPLHPEDA